MIRVLILRCLRETAAEHHVAYTNSPGPFLSKLFLSLDIVDFDILYAVKEWSNAKHVFNELEPRIFVNSQPLIYTECFGAYLMVLPCTTAYVIHLC